MSTYKAVVRSDELYHFNKNHDRLGRFGTGDGDGDGVIDDNHNRKKNRQYSAKIENYHKGNAFRKPYYVDKNGHKRSYMSYKEMPVEAQNTEIARQKGKDFVKKVGSTTLGIASTIGVTIGSVWLYNKFLG